MPKQNALQKIESHEKLCRIMQKLTHNKIHGIEDRVKRLEKILWNVRYVTLLAVILSIISSVYLMFLGSWEIIEAILFYNPLIDSSISKNNELLFKIIYKNVVYFLFYTISTNSFRNISLND